MRTQTVANRFQLFVASATIAAHASKSPDGFRQRDVRFFIELFSNWAEAEQSDEPPLRNVQIQRYLEGLSTEGYLKRASRSGAPAYRLTRIGLLDLLTRLIRSAPEYRPEHFLFLLFFIEGYRDRLQNLVKQEGAQFPPALRIELQALLDPRELVQEELRRVRKRVAKLEVRAKDAHRTRELVAQRISSRVPLNEIIEELERKIPYELNSRKPLSELIAGIQPDQREWELTIGNHLRAVTIWEPHLDVNRTYQKILTSILERSGDPGGRGP